MSNQESYTDRNRRFKRERRERAEAALPDDPSFEDYLQPHGEYGFPIYVAFPEVAARVAHRRAAFLESEYKHLSGKHALTIAGHECDLGYNWVADELGVTRATVDKYREKVNEWYGYDIFTTYPPTDIERELNVGVPYYGRCPFSDCGKDAVSHVDWVRRVYPDLDEERRRTLRKARNTDEAYMCVACSRVVSVK
jgi:hypothetical protein